MQPASERKDEHDRRYREHDLRDLRCQREAGKQREDRQEHGVHWRQRVALVVDRVGDGVKRPPPVSVARQAQCLRHVAVRVLPLVPRALQRVVERGQPDGEPHSGDEDQRRDLGAREPPGRGVHTCRWRGSFRGQHFEEQPDGEAEGGNCTRGHGTCDTTIMLGYCTARRLCLSGSLLFVVAGTTVPAAQEAPKIKPSQHGAVSQRIADTTIALEYNRPVARGRELFGALVPYGKIWCPCADDATTIELSTSVKIDGHDRRRGSTRCGPFRTTASGPSSSIGAPPPGTRATRTARTPSASRSPRARARTWRRWLFTFRQSMGKRPSSFSIGARRSCRWPSKFRSAGRQAAGPGPPVAWEVHRLRPRNFARGNP